MRKKQIKKDKNKITCPKCNKTGYFTTRPNYCPFCSNRLLPTIIIIKNRFATTIRAKISRIWNNKR